MCDEDSEESEEPSFLICQTTLEHPCCFTLYLQKNYFAECVLGAQWLPCLRACTQPLTIGRALVPRICSHSV